MANPTKKAVKPKKTVKPKKKQVKKKVKTIGCDLSANMKQQAFAIEYVALNFNATQAYLATYGTAYKEKTGKAMSDATAAALASRLVANARVIEAVKQVAAESLTRQNVTVDKVIARYDRMASAKITDVIQWEQVEQFDDQGDSYVPKRFSTRITAKDLNDIPPELAANIKSISHGKDGFKVQMVDQKAANDMLFKFLGLDKADKDATNNEIHIHFDQHDKDLC